MIVRLINAKLHRVDAVRALFSVCLLWGAVAVVLISHFRFYYGVQWSNALKWGIGDGFLWSALLYAFIYARRVLDGQILTRMLEGLFVLAALAGGVYLHPTVSTLFFWAIDGSISRPFLEDVNHLAMKRLPQGILAGFVIAFTSIGLVRIHKHKPDQVTRLAHETPTDTSGPNWLFLQNANGVRRINISQIRYAEAAGNYVSLHTQAGVYLERTTLKSIEEKLKSHGFLRISRKHLVNDLYVTALRSKKPKAAIVILDDNLALPVGRQFKISLQAALSISRES